MAAVHPMRQWVRAFWVLFLFISMLAGSLYITLTILELIVDQAGLELIEILLPLPLEYWD